AGFSPGQLGLLKTVQYPTALIGGGFRYQSYNQYHRGQPKNITLPGRYNATTMAFTREINDFGWVTQTTDFEQNTTHYGYDNIGRIQYVDPADARWADTFFNWSYTFGQPIRTVSRCTLNAQRNGCADAAKSMVTTHYDGLLRPTLITNTDVLNQITVYQNHRYTAFNQPAFQSYASISPTEINGVSFSYDALGRVRSQTSSGGGTVTSSYLANNRIKVSSQVDSNQVNETTTTYLAYGTPSYQLVSLIQSPENVTTAIARNLYGNITSVTQSGYHGSTPVNQTEHRAYDSQQRLCQIARTDVGTTVMGHNSGGEMIWQALGQTAASHSICNGNVSDSQKLYFGYDNLGEKYTVTGTNSPSVTYTLNKNGDLTHLVSGSVSQTYAYNSARLLESETLALGSKSLNLDYQYNSLGHLSSLTYPNASEVSFNPNGFGQSQQATRMGANYATNAKYHPNGIINTFTYGNGISHKTSLNTRQMPNKIHDHLAGSDRLNLSYTYDYQNNVKSIIDGIDANFSLTHLNYDGLDRLTSTVGGNGIGDSNLSYDGLGNIRTYRTLNSNKDHNFNYQYDTNTFRLTGVTGTGAAGYNFNHSTNGVPDSYDNRGNVTHNGIRSFKYNPLNHMTESDGNQYLYDGFNRRVKISDSNGTSYSMYSQAGKLLYRETKDGGINYIFLGDKLIAKEGMMPVNTNSRMHYKPFGDSIEAPKDDVGYTGHKFDTDLGWSYMQQRYKDPVVGRFMSNDPVGFTGEVDTFNRYVYAANNPYKYTDPDGRSKKQGEAAQELAGAMAVLLGMTSQAEHDKTMGRPAASGNKKGNKKNVKNKPPSNLHTKGKKIPDGRKIESTIPGSNKIKNANGETFKRVDVAPSPSHGGLSPHTHPNFRNTTPNGKVRSGVSKKSAPVNKRDIIDASREGGQRTGGS
ncbi:MAG: RHS repeat-associated protein, partial [Phenylobacterium sp.]